MRRQGAHVHGNAGERRANGANSHHQMGGGRRGRPARARGPRARAGARARRALPCLCKVAGGRTRRPAAWRAAHREARGRRGPRTGGDDDGAAPAPREARARAHARSALAAAARARGHVGEGRAELREGQAHGGEGGREWDQAAWGSGQGGANPARWSVGGACHARTHTHARGALRAHPAHSSLRPAGRGREGTLPSIRKGRGLRRRGMDRRGRGRRGAGGGEPTEATSSRRQAEMAVLDMGTPCRVLQPEWGREGPRCLRSSACVATEPTSLRGQGKTALTQEPGVVRRGRHARTLSPRFALAHPSHVLSFLTAAPPRAGGQGVGAVRGATGRWEGTEGAGEGQRTGNGSGSAMQGCLGLGWGLHGEGSLAVLDKGGTPLSPSPLLPFSPLPRPSPLSPIVHDARTRTHTRMLNDMQVGGGRAARMLVLQD